MRNERTLVLHQVKLALGFTLLILATSFESAEATESFKQQEAKRPNVVFAFADDLGRYASRYSDPRRPSPNDVIQTPNFDRVAREGTVFQNAFVSAPSCTPSRAAIVSCRHFFRNGSHSQLHHPWMKGYPDPWDEVKGFPLMLQEQGYHIGWSYKMHISEDRMGGKERNYRSAGNRFNSFSQAVSRNDDTEAAKDKLLEEVRGNFQAFLSDRAEDQPFFYWFNPTNTHRAWVQGSGKELWGIDPDDLKGRLPSFLPDEALIRQDMADYLGEAMAFDAAVGVLLEELERIDELEQTIFVVSGDHGAPGFPRGKCNLYDFGSQVLLAIRWPESIAANRSIDTPVSLIDLGPTFLDAAGIEPSDDMNGESLLPAMDSTTEDYESTLRGYAIIGREKHVDDSRPGGLPYPMRAIRTREHLLIINFAPDRWPVAQPPLNAPLVKGMVKRDGESTRRMDIDFGPTREFFVEHEGDEAFGNAWGLGFGLRPRIELYNVLNDPDQVNNLADLEASEEIKTRLESKLMEILIANEDPRVVGDGDAFDRPPYAKDDPLKGMIQTDQ